MVTINNASGKNISEAIKLNNVSSLEEGWKFINDYSINYCELHHYDNFAIQEYYDDKAYASVLFFYFFNSNEVVKFLSFDISEFEKFEEFTTYKPYKHLTFVNWREIQRQSRVLSEVIKNYPCIKINSDNGRTKETAIKITEAPDHRIGWEFIYNFMDRYKVIEGYAFWDREDFYTEDENGFLKELSVFKFMNSENEILWEIWIDWTTLFHVWDK